MARGDITQSAGLGKRIDRLPYEVVQVDGFEPVKVMIDVYMSKKFDHSEGTPKPVSGASFRLRHDGVAVDGTDIDACIRAMRSRLDKRYAIKWETWLKVMIEKSRFYGMHEGSGLELKWDQVERGVAYDGQVLMREYSRNPDRTWNISPWPEYFKDRSGKTLACIPKTDESVRALEVFRDKIDEMRKVLADFVSPEKIEETLALISSGGLTLISDETA